MSGIPTSDPHRGYRLSPVRRGGRQDDLGADHAVFESTPVSDLVLRPLGRFLRGRSIEPCARLQGVCKCGIVCVFQVGP